MRVAVADAKGKGDSAEVTLWAVDYGILSLTGFDGGVGRHEIDAGGGKPRPQRVVIG